jgi:hypothetical protein
VSNLAGLFARAFWNFGYGVGQGFGVFGVEFEEVFVAFEFGFDGSSAAFDAENLKEFVPECL